MWVVLNPAPSPLPHFNHKLIIIKRLILFRQEYFCCAEYPSALCALGLITDEVLNLLTPLQRRTEVERFKYKTEELLNHTRNQECFGRAKVLVFDGKQDESNRHCLVVEILDILFVQLFGSLFICIIVPSFQTKGKMRKVLRLEFCSKGSGALQKKPF